MSKPAKSRDSSCEHLAVAELFIQRAFDQAKGSPMDTILARMGRSVKKPMKAAAAHQLHQAHSSTYTILRAVTRLVSHCVQAVSCQTAEHVGAGLCVLQQHAK